MRAKLLERLAGTEATAACIGRFRLLECVGEGAHGIVYAAYDPQLDRRVAIKLLRRHGSAHRQLLREARALAQIAHPNVVSVYEVGEADGDVFIAMEFVDGMTLDRWLASAPRTTPEILAVLSAAGRGLEKAHAHGIVHRDFKASNVMIGHDGRVRIADFGLAQSQPVDTETSVAPTGIRIDDGSAIDSQPGVPQGTPAYMAPEQHAGYEADVRSDQYSFCVTAWEALSGRHPFELPRPKEAGTPPGDALPQRRFPDIAELERLKAAGPPAWSAPGSTVPSSVVKALQRGMAVAPADRWPAMEALLAQLQLPMFRRARARWLAAAVVTIATLAIGWQIRSREQAARQVAACVSEGAAVHAVWEDTRADRIAAAFASSGLGYAAETWGRAQGRIDAFAEQWAHTRRNVCEQADIARTLAPATAAASRTCLDDSLAELAGVVEQFATPDAGTVRRAVSAIASLPRPQGCTDPKSMVFRVDPPVDPATHDRIRILRTELARAAAANALGHGTKALQQAEAVVSAASELDLPQLEAEARLAVGLALEQLERHDEARVALEAAFYRAGAIGRDDIAEKAASALAFLIGVRLGLLEASEPWSDLAQMFIARLNQSGDLAQAQVFSDIGATRLLAGKYDEALGRLEPALAIRERLQGTEHPDVATVLTNIGNVFIEAQDYAKAITALQRALSTGETALGRQHPLVAMILMNLAVAQLNLGEIAAARAHLERAVGIFEHASDGHAMDLAAALNTLGQTYVRSDDARNAISQFERAVAVAENVLGPVHLTMGKLLTNLASAHLAVGEYSQAISISERALAIADKMLPPDHLDIASLLSNLSRAYQQTDRLDDAAIAADRAFRIRQNKLDPDDRMLGASLVRLGRVYAAQRKYTEARSAYARALPIYEHANDDRDLAELLLELAEAGTQLGRPSDVVPYAQRAVVLYERLGNADPELTRARLLLARATRRTAH